MTYRPSGVCPRGPVPKSGADLLGHRFGLREEQQIVAPARLRVRAGHVEPTEGMASYQGAGAFAVEGEVTDEETLRRRFEFFPVLRVNGDGQPVLVIVPDLARIVQVPGFDHGKGGDKKFFLRDAPL